MKKAFFAAAVFAVATLSATLFGAEIKKIPILWKAKTEEPKKFQIAAFGFLEDKEDVIFAFQIKDAAELIKLKSYLSQYYNADNDVNTGRFPKNLGIDLQINGRIYEGANFQPMTWNNENKATNLKVKRGDRDFLRKGDVIYFILSKEVLGDLKFKPQFIIEAGIFIDGKYEGPKPVGIPARTAVDTARTFGEFEMPEPK